MRVLFIIIVLASCQLVRGQVLISLVLGDKLNSGKVEFGLDGGVNYSTQSASVSTKLLQSFNLGFYFDVKTKGSWMFHTGVIVKSNMGASGLPVYSLGDPGLDAQFAGGSIDRKLNYFNVPFLMKYNFRNHLYVEGGPQLGLMYKAFDEFTNTINGQVLTYRVNVRDQYHPLDAGLMGGIGYRLLGGNGMNITARYYYGFVDIRIANAGNPIANRTLYLTVGIPIGAGKARSREAERNKNKE